MKNIITLAIIIISVTTLAFFLFNNRTPVSTEELDKDVSFPATDPTDETSLETEPEEIFELKVEKPASFAGVEMVTYQSEYGFEITYPKEWQKNYFNLSADNNNSKFNTYVLKTNTDNVNQKKAYMTIDTDYYEKEIIDSMNVSISDKMAEKILVNKINGFYIYEINNIEAYIFYNVNKIYTIKLINYTYSLSDSEKEELLWVLSTFKITD